MNIEEVKKMKIPASSGCYKFLNTSGEVIYVGKAVNLKSRVFSYWQKSTQHSPAKTSMIKKIADIEWVETDSEVEALLLEANLIKKFQPRYNIVMRDDKRYVYIKITAEDFPRIFMTRKIDRSGRYFGPFTSSEAVRETLKIIRRIWPYRSCVHMPARACLYYRIGKCPAPCEVKIDKAEYGKIIKQITLFLEGAKSRIVKNIEKELCELEKKKEKNREDEAKIFVFKKRLLDLREVLGNSRILSLTDKYAADVVELAKILGLEKIPERIEGYDISNIFGAEAVGSMVVFTGGEPDKSEYRKFKIKADDKKGDTQMMEEVLDRRLKRSRDLIWREGDKSLTPLYPSLVRGERFDKKYWVLPDLVIVDGGKGQLNSVLKIFKKNNVKIPVIAVSKGEGLRSSRAPDKIFFPGEKKPLELSLNSPAMHIIKRVRDEAHRFAIKYHRELKRKKLFQ